MDIEVECRACGQRMVVEESGAGMTVPCPSCGAEVVVPKCENLLGSSAQNAIQPQRVGDAPNPFDELVIILKFCIQVGVIVIGMYFGHSALKHLHYRPERTARKYVDSTQFLGTWPFTVESGTLERISRGPDDIKLFFIDPNGRRYGLDDYSKYYQNEDISKILKLGAYGVEGRQFMSADDLRIAALFMSGNY